MASTLRRFRPVLGGPATDTGAYLPSQQEIAEKTAEIREDKRKRKQAVEREKERAALNRLSKSPKLKKREMTRAEICNVEPLSDSELLEALGMDGTRWTLTDGSEAGQ